jgi:hypothetical protein
MGRSVNDGTPCSSQLIHAEQRIAELEQENERLRAECGLRQIHGYREGMECAADIADKHPTGWQAAEAIHAVLEPITRPEQER